MMSGSRGLLYRCHSIQGVETMSILNRHSDLHNESLGRSSNQTASPEVDSVDVKQRTWETCCSTAASVYR
jgi:hypothetical protein